MTAKDRLLQEEQLVELMLKHSYIPQRSAQNFNNMLAALREINPGAKYDPGCMGCMMDIANQAKIFINMIKEERKQELTFMTFPKKCVIEAGLFKKECPEPEEKQEPEVKRKPGRPKK